ncbi:MAG: hypothetical protein AAFY60_18730, partial [Myxococcota bacterium]
RFDLRDGACLKGDESVRSFPARVAGTVIEVNIVEPAIEPRRESLLQTLKDGLFHGRPGQVDRALARLLQIGTSPETLSGELARYDADHNEWGITHAMPAALDVLKLIELPGEPLDALLPLALAAEVLGETAIRLGARPLPPSASAASEMEFLDAFRRQDASHADGLVRGAWARGARRGTLEPWFMRACSEHFLALGHGLIFSVKAFDLLSEVSEEHAPAILGALAHGICQQTREDVLPEWRWFRREMEVLTPRLEGWIAQTRRPLRPEERTRLLNSLLDGERRESLHVLAELLEDGAHLECIVDTLSVAASHRLLRFDPNLDRDPSYQEGWLDVTHTLTFTEAVRYALRRDPRAHSLALLFQAARFINSTGALDGSELGEIRPFEGDRQNLWATLRQEV